MKPALPTDLRIVAYLHLAIGLYSLVTVLLELFNSTISFDLGVLGIPICHGLLHRRDRWRKCAIWLLTFGVVVLPIIFLMGLTGWFPAYYWLFGRLVSAIPSWVVSLLTIPWFLLVLWQLGVLRRDDVAQLFRKQEFSA